MIASSYILPDSLLRNIIPYSVQKHATSATNTKYKESKFFYIHMSVHRNIIPNYSQQGELFYLFIFRDMFQAVPLPIIRSTQLYIQLQVLSTNTAASCYRGRIGPN
jgi:hypothetical protein